MLTAKNHHDLYDGLRSVVGEKYVSDDHAILLAYTKDISVAPAAKTQGVVVRPGSVEEVVEIVRLANETRTPIIPMGGKASLCGVPPGQPGRGIIVDMKRMDKVIEINETNMTVTAQGGIAMGELAAKLNEKGFDYHTSGTPHYVATIAGNVSGIPGGGFGFWGQSVGFNWRYILGVKVVLPNGSVIDTGTGEGSLSHYRGNTWGRGMHGPDLTGIFIGDGGIFGIKVEVTYRMFRLPKFIQAGGYCWADLDQAYAAYSELWNVEPSMYMQPFATAMILGPEIASSFIPGIEPEWTLTFTNVGQNQEEIDLKTKSTSAICEKHGGRDAGPAVAAFGAQFVNQVREMGKMGSRGQRPLFELIVSRRDQLDALKWTREFLFNSLKERGYDPTKVPLFSVLLAAGPGHGMTTSNPQVNPNDIELRTAVTEIWLDFLENGRRRGYALEATHGHESLLIAKSWTPEFYNQILNLKKTWDPNNIMNPGVFFP